MPRTEAPPATPTSRRRTSASVVLRSVLEHGPVARSTIARLTGLSPASVTDYCSRFTELGLIRESAAPRQSNGVGRPHVPVDLDDSRFVVGGVHVAVPYTTVALLDLRGRVVARRELKHEHSAPGPVLARAAEGLAALLAGSPGCRPLGVGVAVGGWVDRDSGTVVEHPLLGWREVPVREVLGARTGLPVHVDGHARALVNAERLFGGRAAAGACCICSSATWWTRPSRPTTRCTTGRAPRRAPSPICRCRAARSPARAAGPVASRPS